MKPSWDHMGIAVETLANKIDRIDKDGIDLDFTIGLEHKCTGVKDTNQLLRVLTKAKLQAFKREHTIATDMERSLRRIFDDFLQSSSDTRHRKAMKLIVLTDGVWGGTSDPRKVEEAIVEFLRHKVFEGKMTKRWFTIQFISFSDVLPDILRSLDDDMAKKYSIPDVIDTVTIRGDVYKMILGSVTDEFDASPTTPTAPTSPGTPDLRLPPLNRETLSPPSPTPSRQSSTRSGSRTAFGNIFRG
ncbi:hypothetical protein F4778DRAFT_795905 [Xylariomycetidae sp. FL2044]|nr:hypothetical protein F4778DRAFT_795905 [Xylariomycetidae sp. FL2044]